MGLTDKVKSKFADASDRLDDLERKIGKDDKGEDEAAPAQMSRPVERWASSAG